MILGAVIGALAAPSKSRVQGAVIGALVDAVAGRMLLELAGPAADKINEVRDGIADAADDIVERVTGGDDDEDS